MQTAYKVMLLDRSIEKTKFIFEKIDYELKMFERAYATEMSIMNEQPLEFFHFEDNQICVAFTESFDVLGFIAFGFNPISKILFVEHSYTSPYHRHKGVYKTMFKRIEKLAQDMNANKICAFVFNKNSVSLAAHKKLGFKQKITGFFKEVTNDN